MRLSETLPLLRVVAPAGALVESGFRRGSDIVAAPDPAVVHPSRG